MASWRANSAMSSDVTFLPLLKSCDLLADALGQHALAAQVGFDRGLGDGEHLALDALALLVGAFPDERELLSGSYLSHGSVLTLMSLTVR